MMRDEWFCSGPEGRYGPLTLGELKDALARHPHASDIYIWHESFPDWVRAGDLGELDLLQAAEPARQQWAPDVRANNGSRPMDFAPQYERQPVDRHRYEGNRYDDNRLEDRRQDTHRHDGARFDGNRLDNNRFDGNRFDASPYQGRQYDAPRFDDGRHHEAAAEEETAEPVKRRFSILGMLVGLSLMAVGGAVIYLGMIGELARVTELLDIDNGDIDTAAGAVFVVIGVVIIWCTRTKVAD
jgi:hypothetical protein